MFCSPTTPRVQEDPHGVKAELIPAETAYGNDSGDGALVYDLFNGGYFSGQGRQENSAAAGRSGGDGACWLRSVGECFTGYQMSPSAHSRNRPASFDHLREYPLR